jgi:hypothetical protein
MYNGRGLKNNYNMQVPNNGMKHMRMLQFSVGIFGPNSAKVHHVNPNNSNKISKAH